MKHHRSRATLKDRVLLSVRIAPSKPILYAQRELLDQVPVLDANPHGPKRAEQRQHRRRCRRMNRCGGERGHSLGSGVPPSTFNERVARDAKVAKKGVSGPNRSSRQPRSPPKSHTSPWSADVRRAARSRIHPFIQQRPTPLHHPAPFAAFAFNRSTAPAQTHLSTSCPRPHTPSQPASPPPPP